ncbi:unnamed protein product [Allacma fusca]|uniref:Uncharacterized protein n=1 Tax=Allacma fusca TaxID=39272 RepID=A0A8J2PAC7_9HEXA|nr:unnamed protein product [Allacma fusca]
MLKVFHSLRIKKPFSRNKDKESKKGKKKSQSEPELGSASTTGDLESAGASSVVTNKKSTPNTGPSGSSNAVVNNTTSPETRAGTGSGGETSEKYSSPDGTSKENSGKKKKNSPSHSSSSGSGKSGKSSSKKKSVEFNERSVDEPPQKQEAVVEEDPNDTEAKRCCACGGGYKGYLTLDGLTPARGSGVVASNGAMVIGGDASKRGSLLGEIIAELDDLLGTTYFCEPPPLPTKIQNSRSHNYTAMSNNYCNMLAGSVWETTGLLKDIDESSQV